jgi:hypothetical protein
MQSRTARRRLVYPVAAIVAFGLVSVPQSTASTPRLIEVSAVRLQAEVTALVSGIADTVEAGTPAAAASSLTGTGAPAAAAATCTYPCTVFDKFLSSLPESIRNAILPPLIVVAWVIGLVMSPALLVTSAVFGWPYSLRPAAATTPETSPAAAEVTAALEVTSATSDQPPVQADPGVSSSTPGDTANAGEVVVGIPAATADDPARGGAHSSRGETIPVASPESPESPESTESPESSESPESTETPGLVPAAAESPTVSAPADVLTPAMTATADGSPVTPRLARAGGRSPHAEPSDSSPTPQRAAKRSAR